jgi:hypothetical protein
MRTLLMVLLAVASTAAAQSSPVQPRLRVTWGSPLPSGAIIKLEVQSEAMSVTTITDIWNAVQSETRSIDVPLPERSVFDSTLQPAGHCQRVSPSQARLGWLSLGVWVGSARVGQLELLEGERALLVGYADRDSVQPDSPQCKDPFIAPVLAAGWNVLRTGKDGKGVVRPLKGSLTARYVSALP